MELVWMFFRAQLNWVQKFHGTIVLRYFCHLPCMSYNQQPAVCHDFCSRISTTAIHFSTSGVKHLRDAMVLMELPTGANQRKTDTARDNVIALMGKAHAIRCPGNQKEKSLT